MSEGFATTAAVPQVRWLRRGAVFALGLLGLGLYALAFRPITQEVVALEADLERTQRQIVQAGFAYPENPGAYLENVERKLARMRQLAEALTARFAFDSGIEEVLGANFRVLEFEQRRFDIRQNLSALAGAQASSLPADLFAGLPSYYTLNEEQQELWLHLEFFNHVMEALLSSGPDLEVELVESLPLIRPGDAAFGLEAQLLQIQLRLKLKGPFTTLATFLNQSLPVGNVSGEQEKKAFSIERLNLQGVAADGQVTLNAVLSGFLFTDQDF
ncbi:MAG: hypothetical protein ACNA77_05645 [Opitutales bacterium]